MNKKGKRALAILEEMDRKKAEKRKYKKYFKSWIFDNQIQLIPNLSPANSLDYFTFPKDEMSYIDENIIYIMLSEEKTKDRIIGMMNVASDISGKYGKIDLLSELDKLNWSLPKAVNGNKYIYVTYKGRRLTLHKFLMEQLSYDLNNDIDHLIHTYKYILDNRISNFIALPPKLNRKKANCFDKVIANCTNVKVYAYIDWYSSIPILFLAISYMEKFQYKDVYNGENVTITYYLEKKRVYLKFNDILPQKISKSGDERYLDILERVARNITDTNLLKSELKESCTTIYFYEQYFEISLKDCQKEISSNINRLDKQIEEHKDTQDHILNNDDFTNTLYKINIPHITDIKIISNDGEILYEAVGEKKVVRALFSYVEKNMQKL